MAKGASTSRNVGFVKEVTTIRPPRDDELFVMTHFARHAVKCPDCVDPYEAYKQDRPLCSRGRSLAKDVAAYLYAKGGKPFSVIDRKLGDRAQVEVPLDCAPVTQLIKAFGKGMNLDVRRAVTISDDRAQRHVQPTSTSRSAPTQERPRERRYLHGDYDLVEIVPASSRQDRRERPVYRSDRYERSERPKTYYSERKGSLYVRDEEERRRRQRYEEQPVIIIAEPRHHRYSVHR